MRVRGTDKNTFPVGQGSGDNPAAFFLHFPDYLSVFGIERVNEEIAAAKDHSFLIHVSSPLDFTFWKRGVADCFEFPDQLARPGVQCIKMTVITTDENPAVLHDR
ncbi:hypothetical protein D3C87_1660070 [compost metagenome]